MNVLVISCANSVNAKVIGRPQAEMLESLVDEQKPPSPIVARMNGHFALHRYQVAGIIKVSCNST